MRPNVLIPRLPHLMALVAIGVTGCADERKGPGSGELGGKCFPNGTCDAGLVCGGDNTCAVAPPAGTLGGACFGNGQCYDGLVCDGTVCIEDNAIPTGTLGGACYPNGTCLSPDLHCVDSTCQVLEARQGTAGGACYANGSCNPGLVCENGACEADAFPAGTNGGACLANGTCWAGLLCNGNTCEPDTRLTVGTEDAACFPNGTCNAGLECVIVNGSSACHIAEPIPYGTLDNPCYPNNTCNGGLVCDLGTCVPSGTQVTEPPGSVGGLCFPNGTCNSGNVCNSFGFCEEIVAGGLFGECLQGGLCNLGLSCYDDQCLPTVEHLGSIHGVVTDYIDNARLDGVQVTLIHEGQVLTSTTDSLGYYHFDNLKPGHFEITFDKLDGSHTMRRLSDVLVACPIGAFGIDLDGVWGAFDLQDQECNQRHDIDLFPFSGTQHGRLWYLNDQEVTPAAGVRVVADYSDLCGCTDDNCNAPTGNECQGDNCGEAVEADGRGWRCPGVDISPDRFVAVTDEDGRFAFTDLPNTGGIGVRITVMPSVFNGFDYESWGPVFRRLDVFVEDNVEVFLTPQFDPPFIVANNWEDYLYGGYDVSEPIEMTFSRSMKTMGCEIHVAYADDYKAGDYNHYDRPVAGTLVWSNDNMTATFTPATALSTSHKYAVHVHNCESAIDDQEYNWISGGHGGVDGGGDLCCNIEGNACYSSEWNRQDFITQDGIECEYTSDACFGPDTNFEITCTMAPNLDDSEFTLNRVVRYPGHAEENPDGDLGYVLVPVSFTATADGNTVIVDPTESLDPAGEYWFSWSVASFIENDVVSGGDSIGVSFCESTETIEFLFANVPVVSGRDENGTAISWLETTNGAQNIVATFTKDVNLALSFVTLENDDAEQNNAGTHGDDGQPVDYDQFGLILDTTITADGAVITIDPAADLDFGRYTVRYVVAAADGLGVAVGHFTFLVVPAPACIAFVADNLGDRANVNYQKPVWLHFSTGVDANDERNIIKLTDEFGGEWWPSFTTGNYTPDGGDEVVDGRVIFGGPAAGWFSPDRTYTVTFKIYAAASRDHIWQGADEIEEIFPNGNGGFCGGTEHGIYTQSTVSFTTEGHITLASTTVGAYSDKNNDGYYVPEDCDFDAAGDTVDCGDFQGSESFAVNGVISLTFTETPDLAVYHERNFARLYRFTGTDEDNATHYDLVATTNTLSGNTITMALLPQQTLQTGGELYCIGYQVTSNIVIGGNADVSENVGGTPEGGNLVNDITDPLPGEGIVPQFCFRTVGAPVAAPPTAPTAAPELRLVYLVDGDDTTVTLRHSVLTGAPAGTVGGGTRWYEYYVSAEDGDINDYLLWNVYEDCSVSTQDLNDCVAANTVLGPNADGTTRAGLAVQGQDVWGVVCNAPDAPAYCLDNLPFGNGDSVFFRVRACTGSVGDDVSPLCGPYSAALEVSDSIPPDLLVYVMGAEANDDENSSFTDVIAAEGVDDSCDGEDNDALTFNVFGFASLDLINNQPPSTRESLGGAATIVVRQGGSSAILPNVNCVALQSTNNAGAVGTPNNSWPLDAPAAYTSYAPDWYTPADSWPNWVTDANGWNTTGITMYDHRAAAWMYFPPLSVVTFKCTVPTGFNPLVTGPGGLNSTINITASDTSGNPKSASRPVPAGDQCAQ